MALVAKLGGELNRILDGELASEVVEAAQFYLFDVCIVFCSTSRKGCSKAVRQFRQLLVVVETRGA